MFALKTKLNALDAADANDDANDGRNDGCDEGVSGLTAIMAKCSLIEREDSDPENSAFAGGFAMLLKSMVIE